MVEYLCSLNFLTQTSKIVEKSEDEEEEMKGGGIHLRDYCKWN